MNSNVASKLLLDPHAVKVLKATYDAPLSAHQICLKFDIPVARCYALVKKMEEAGLLKVEKFLPLPGGTVRKSYRSSIKSITLNLENGHVMTSVQLREGDERITLKSPGS